MRRGSACPANDECHTPAGPDKCHAVREDLHVPLVGHVSTSTLSPDAVQRPFVIGAILSCDAGYGRFRYLPVSTAARNRSSDSTSAGSATVSAISCRKSSRYLLRSR
jgi:hypothetical protein